MSKKYSITDMKNIALKHGGECLSTEYKNARTKIKWKCQCGHIWENNAQTAIAGSWCIKCASRKRGDQYRFSLQDAQNIATERGGKCVSKNYTNCKEYLEWECASGHSWYAPFGRIKFGAWCPRCSKNFTEEKCRFIIEHLTKNIFNPSKIKKSHFIFDGYCKKLNLAFEYHGEQHYHDIPHFQRTLSLEKRIEYDKQKTEICDSAGIRLLTIPYWIAKEGDKSLISFISKKLKVLQIEIKSHINMNRLYKYVSPLIELRQLAQKRGGKCLSTSYIDSTHHLEWECERKHKWLARPNHVKNGTWCKKCSNRKTIKDMQILANKKHGKCLSTYYENAHIKLQWQCSCGHKWFATPNKIQQGRWCKRCAN